MPTYRIVSPERRWWRAGVLVVLSRVSFGGRLFRYAGPWHGAAVR